jgi:hypothetical protein
MKRFAAALVLGICSLCVAFAGTERHGLFSGAFIPSGTGAQDPDHRALSCDPGSYLVSFVLSQTDRIVNLSIACVSADKSQSWTSPPATGLPLFPLRASDFIRNLTCPKNYYVVGLTATQGTYSGNTSGGATTGSLLMADFQPVCRNGQVNDLFIFPSGRLHKADNNNLIDGKWQGLGGEFSCDAGWAAVGLKLAVNSRRDIDPDRQFNDVALICDRLPFRIPVDHITH